MSSKLDMFKGILDNWKYDFKHNPVIFWLEFIGTLACIIAAGSLAYQAPHPNMIPIYYAYMTGSLTLAISSYMRNNGFWVVLNMFFFCVDIFGMHNALTG